MSCMNALQRDLAQVGVELVERERHRRCYLVGRFKCNNISGQHKQHKYNSIMGFSRRNMSFYRRETLRALENTQIEQIQANQSSYMEDTVREE